ncbi:precorrin-6A/cobalt-precorrin-6A reductase [Breoghania sp.]|uniref:precorrin-6A/cobalt-precorrin-6A reductase n=1 Tax=Breoghania sp. TaxID=2065378 RepID=UPI00261202BD|nr:precorrin-6A/cobalt-precorrin-6A reductase [Breoghania sp.]MDJ0930949.1 precorrin-6A/cobalt-precorrin-6A reductase [Breoghania sp.]
MSEGDVWHDVAMLTDAAAMLPEGARVFLCIGRKEVGVFAARRDVSFVMRMIEPPEAGAILPPGEVLLSRSEADAAAEAALFRRHAITHLVAKNSGDLAGYAKIEAARKLGLSVVMVARPPSSGGTCVTNVEEAVRSVGAWIAAR